MTLKIRPLFTFMHAFYQIGFIWIEFRIVILISIFRVLVVYVSVYLHVGIVTYVTDHDSLLVLYMEKRFRLLHAVLSNFLINHGKFDKLQTCYNCMPSILSQNLMVGKKVNTILCLKKTTFYHFLKIGPARKVLLLYCFKLHHVFDYIDNV